MAANRSNVVKPYVIGGFVATILFAAFLATMAFIVLNDSSPARLIKEIGNEIEATEHDEK